MLPPQTVQMIEQLDKPHIKQVGTDTILIRNYGEDDVTGYVKAGKGYFFKRFRAGGRRFLFDSASGQSFQISELEWKMLDQLPAYNEDMWVNLLTEFSEEDVRAAYRRLWTLLHPVNGGRFVLPTLPPGKELIELFLPNILLINTTEQCNIRCTYCYFSGNYEQTRVHRPIKNKFSQIQPIIDRFLENHEMAQGAQRAIYFFGGEPLLNFELIKDVILYIRKVAHERKMDISNIIYQIATNAMVLNQQIADFLAKHQVNVNVSIDGPNHDLYRVDALGRGTLNKVMEKVEWLCEHYNEYYRHFVGLTCVVSPPYNIEELYHFFVNWRPAQEALHLDFDLILPGNKAIQEDFQALKNAKRQLWNMFVQTHAYPYEKQRSSWFFFFTTGFNFLHRAFSRVLWRKKGPARNGQTESINGMFRIPGTILTAVGANGKLYASYEYQDKIFEIGSVDMGYNADKMIEMAENFRQANQSGSCGTCWAARLCQIDYPDFYISPDDDERLVKSKLLLKSKRCQSERFDLASALAAIETIRLEYGEDALNYMQEDHEIVKRMFYGNSGS